MMLTDKVDVGPLQFQFVMRFLRRIDQGLRISVFERSSEPPRELVRFDCYDERAHYHYDPAGRNERLDIDMSLVDNPLEWALGSIRHRLAAMLEHAGACELAASWQSDVNRESYVDLVCDTARFVEHRDRRTIKHKHGDSLVEAGVVTFGLEYFRTPTEQGPSIHVLTRVDGDLIEVLCFDCYDKQPHYHYGPLSKNVVLPIDVAAVGDPLDWALDQIRLGRLGAMLVRAGFPQLNEQLDPVRLAILVETAIRPQLANLASQASPM